MQFLGIKIDEISKEQALERVSEFLNGGQYKIFTPNPEFVVKAQKDEYFKKVLNAGDLNLCDGMGLWLALRLSFRPKQSGVEKSLSSQSVRDPSTAARFAGASARRVGMTIERISGVDFMLEICQLAAERGSGVYLLGSGSDDVVRKTVEELQKQFPNLKIVGYNKGPMINEQNPTLYPSPYRGGSDAATSVVNVSPPIRGRTEEGVLVDGNNSTSQLINQSHPDILFVAFGMGKQEKWIHENLSKMPGVKIAMGVGGSFDYISGKVKRAPFFLRKVGLEWMYRLFKQPSRFIRIFNATAKFIWLVLFRK